MRMKWWCGSSALRVALAIALIALWVVGVDESRGSRQSDTYILWDGDSAANVFGMAIIGLLAGFVAGGLLGLAWPWRLLGLAAMVPFAGLMAVFSLLSGGGGSCAGAGGPCSVSAFFRFGGLLVVLGCCTVAAVTARLLSTSHGATSRDRRSRRP